MKSRAKSFLSAVAVLLASATLAIAQTSGYYNSQPAPYNRYNQPQQQAAPASVRPGTLNYVEGQVSSDGQTLSPQSIGNFTLQPGQVLDTGNGYAEVLLTPGAFLRIGNNTEIRLTTASLAGTRVDLVHGSALIEVDQFIKGTQLTVGMGNNTSEVIKNGLYSFDTNQQAVQVLDGKLKVISADKTREIGRDDEVLLSNLKKTSFNPDQVKMQPLYVWSQARSRDEAGQNQMASNNAAGYVPAGAGWFWDPYAGYYGFWPSSYLYSPFGYGFYGGFYPGFYGGYGYYHGFRYGHPGGLRTSVGVYGHSAGGFHGGFGGGFHGGGFHGGGFHGGGGHR